MNADLFLKITIMVFILSVMIILIILFDSNNLNIRSLIRQYGLVYTSKNKDEFGELIYDFEIVYYNRLNTFHKIYTSFQELSEVFL